MSISAALAATAPPARAQESGDVTEELEPITVTGTRLKRVDEEDLQPLTVITRQQLDDSGYTSIGDALRNLTQNSFGPTTDRDPVSSDNSTTTVSLRGLGAQYTLVLLNGIPLVGAPLQSGGDVQNLNVLPWAAVDRIEILGDGASAIYGSKAIGGVVNVVTRQTFTGVQLTGQIDRPTRSGADSSTASLVAGFRDETANGLVSLEYAKADPLFAHERSFLPPLFSLDSAPPTWRRNDPSGVADQAWHASSNCPSALGSDPRYPNSQLSPVFGDGSQFCMYNFVADAQEIAALERKTLLAQGSKTHADAYNVHALLLVTQNDSRGELAPAASGTIPGAIPADSPFNPTLGEVAPGLGYALDLRYRPVPAGHRILDGDNDVQQLTAGIGGRRLGGWDADWNVDLTATHYGQEVEGRNFASISRFLDAIAAGTFNPFADPSTQDFSQFATSIRNSASHRTQGVTAQVQPRALSVLGVPLEVLGGAEYTHESFSQRDDAAAIAGDVFGAVGTLAGGKRDYRAVFGEAVLNPNGDWQIKAALRRDDYSDVGGALSPKLAAMWKIGDSLLLRASAGKGFHVPDLVTLGGALSSFSEALTDPLGCRLRPDDPIACGSVPREVFLLPNPHLEPETARQLGAGFVWSPTPAFSAGLQGFQTRFRDAIASINEYLVLDNDVACYDAGRPCDTYHQGLVERDADGEIARILVPLSVNAASSTTRGYDVTLRGMRDSAIGTLEAQLVYSRLTHYEQRFPGGTVNAPLGYLGYPHDRANVELGWHRDAWRASVSAHVIGSQRNCDVYDTTAETCADRVPRYTTVDVQTTWKPLDTTALTLGVRNLADRQPFINYNDTYARALYDAIGRVVYFRIEQKFW